MAKKSFTEQHDLLIEKIANKINKAISKSKTFTKHRSEKGIKVSDECAFNLDSGRWLYEVIHNRLIDNEGCAYYFDVLNTEQLCKLADEILN